MSEPTTEELLYWHNLEARVLVLEEALRWYASGGHIDWSRGHPSGTYLKVEDGVKARAALEDT